MYTIYFICYIIYLFLLKSSKKRYYFKNNHTIYLLLDISFVKLSSKTFSNISIGGCNMTIKNLTVAGSGVLGSQIAFQAAYKGMSVTIYDINDEALNKGKERIKK
ncbi:TPA: 3-hydroxyacyl-CoA dehydrogenase NAD-binding domain-containing protein, partial [Streptococcus agalactiae]